MYFRDILCICCHFIFTLFFTNLDRFILMFIRTVLIAVRVDYLSFLPSRFELTKSNRCDFIAKDEWPPIHPTSINWITCGCNAGVMPVRQRDAVQHNHFFSELLLADCTFVVKFPSRSLFYRMHQINWSLLCSAQRWRLNKRLLRNNLNLKSLIIILLSSIIITITFYVFLYTSVFTVS